MFVTLVFSLGMLSLSGYSKEKSQEIEESHSKTINLHVALSGLISTVASLIVLAFTYKRLACIELLGPVFFLTNFIVILIMRNGEFSEEEQIVRQAHAQYMLVVALLTILFTTVSFLPHLLYIVVFVNVYLGVNLFDRS